MVSLFASRAVYRGFEPRSGWTRNYKFSICWFSAKHAAFSGKSKYILARDEDNMSGWNEMFTRGLLSVS